MTDKEKCKKMLAVYRYFRNKNIEEIIELLDSIVLEDVGDEMIVCYAMASNAHLGTNNVIRNNYCRRALEYFSDKDKSDKFLSIFRMRTSDES
jgi:hypothetical protein